MYRCVIDISFFDCRFKLIQMIKLLHNLVIMATTIQLKWLHDESDAFFRLPDAIVTSQSELTIPKRTLEPGVYIIRITTIMANVRLSESDEKYLEIVEEPIYVNIEGGSWKLASWDEDIILNGSSSYDPNILRGNPRDLNFHWLCQVKSDTKLSEIEKRGCFGYGKTIVAQDSSLKKVPASILRENTAFTVTLVAESKVVSGRSSSFQQTIVVHSGTVNKATIE